MMKKLLNRMIITGLCIWFLPYSVSAAKLLVPVGQVVGLELGDQSVTVAAFDDALGSDTRKAGLKIGDEILEINGKEVGTPEDVRSILAKTDGSVELHVERDGKEKRLTVNPRITSDGPRLGVYLRRGVTGIGTVTWYDPDTGKFGTLGHGVNDAGGRMLQMADGKLYPASVISVKSGKAGSPGQLRGAIQGDAIGTLSANTVQGVFGQTDVPWNGEPLPAAAYEEIHTGPATIRATICANTVREYSVDILKIYPESRTDGRNLLLKVTDPALLAATGGIVQGMGVSYNKDNQDNSLACRGAWCQSRFSLTTKIQAYPAQVCGTESTGFCDRDARAKSRQGGLYSSIFDKQATTYSCHTGCRCRTGSVTPFGIFSLHLK